MMSLRELMIEYICFAFTPEELMEKFMIAEHELKEISDEDLLEVYDQTLLTPVEENPNE
jgi:hypothetical protein